MHCAAFRWVTTRCFTVSYLTSRFISLLNTFVHCVSLHYVALHCRTFHSLVRTKTLRCVTWRYVALRYVTFCFITVYHISWISTPCTTSLNVTLRGGTLRCSASIYSSTIPPLTLHSFALCSTSRHATYQRFALHNLHHTALFYCIALHFISSRYILALNTLVHFLCHMSLPHVVCQSPQTILHNLAPTYTIFRYIFNTSHYVTLSHTRFHHIRDIATGARVEGGREVLNFKVQHFASLVAALFLLVVLVAIGLFWLLLGFFWLLLGFFWLLLSFLYCCLLGFFGFHKIELFITGDSFCRARCYLSDIL